MKKIPPWRTLGEVTFKNKDELLNFYVNKEVEVNDQLKNLLKKLKPFPYNKIKIAENASSSKFFFW